MPLIVTYLSTPLSVEQLQTFLASLYTISRDQIWMVNLVQVEVVPFDGMPQIKCDYQFTHGEFPVYLEISIDPDLMPGKSDTQSDYWFARHACRAFQCYALIPLPSSDSYAWSDRKAWIQVDQPVKRVRLVDTLTDQEEPVFVIDRSVPPVIIDGFDGFDDE